MPYNFGDVILIRFPFTNLEASKQRPAIVVSSNAYNLAKPDVILMAVTSQMRASAALGEVWISEWQAANLIKPSAIKPVFATLEQGLILRTLGTLQDSDRAALRMTIADIFNEPAAMNRERT